MSKLEKLFQLQHYKRVTLFILHHPILFIKRLSMYSKVTITWTIVSTVFGFVVFGLVARSLVLTKIDNSKLKQEQVKIQKELSFFKNRDEFKINKELEQQVKENHALFSDSISAYENMTDLPDNDKKLPEFQKNYALVLKYLADKNNTSASAQLKKLSSDIDQEKKSNAAALTIAQGPNPATAPQSNTPPGSGFSRQTVDVNGNKYVVDIVAGNLSSTRVIVDTATDGDCKDNCAVLSLADYVSRNGAYAGINGSYFCPADYPSCAGKSNSFDTLAMNKNKHYINSDNNVYSTVPAVISGNGFLRFVGASQDWGRDTSVDGVLANQPLMVSSGKSVFGGDGDPKKGGAGTRGFIANKGGTAYIGFVHNASVAAAALVLEKMGMDNALNLDSGGSVALWVNGRYQVGPGRNIPNAILFVSK